MADYLDTLRTQVADDMLSDMVHDPAEVPEYPRTPTLIEKGVNVMGKGLWKGLGVIGWPFERIEYSLATPATAALEARRKNMKARGKDPGFGLIRPIFG